MTNFNEVIKTVDDLICFISSLLSALCFLMAFLGDSKKEEKRMLYAIFFAINQLIFSI